MKKLLIILCFFALPSLSSGAGIPVTDIMRFIMEFITNEVLMEEDKVIQNKKLQKLMEVLQEAKQIRARHTELTDIAQDLETELRLAQSVRELALHDLLRIIDKVVSVTGRLYAEDMPYLEEYALLKNAIPGIGRADAVYDFTVGAASVYGDVTGRAPVTYRENAQLTQQQAIRQYGMEVDAAKRALHTAISYTQLAADLREQAADLNTKVNREGRWEMFGIGDLFSDLLDFGIMPGGFGLSELGNAMKGWAGEINQSVFIDKLFGDNDLDDKISGMVQERVSGFDFGGLLGGMLGGITGMLPIPEYRTRIEKEGLRMTTGERIETQGIALDNLEQSIELQLAADGLILESLAKSEHQHQVDATYQNALLRKSLSQIPIQP